MHKPFFSSTCHHNLICLMYKISFYLFCSNGRVACYDSEIQLLIEFSTPASYFWMYCIDIFQDLVVILEAVLGYLVIFVDVMVSKPHWKGWGQYIYVLSLFQISSQQKWLVSVWQIHEDRFVCHCHRQPLSVVGVTFFVWAIFLTMK